MELEIRIIEIRNWKFWLAVHAKDLLKLRKIVSSHTTTNCSQDWTDSTHFLSYLTRDNRGRTVGGGKLSKKGDTRNANTRESAKKWRTLFHASIHLFITDAREYSRCSVVLFHLSFPLFLGRLLFYLASRTMQPGFHPIIFHPISLTIFSKPCICHVVTRMILNTWVWQRIFSILNSVRWS